MLAPEYIEWLLSGFGITVLLSLTSCVAASVIGALVCGLRISQSKLLRTFARTYIDIFRNTPLLVQLFFWYFGAASLLSSDLMIWLNTPRSLSLGFMTLYWPSFEFLAGFIGLTFYTSAFISEELRSGIQAIPQGQHHAAAALGFTPRQIFFLIILPQAIRVSLFPLLGQYMNALKNSSLTMAIGLAELSYASRQVETVTFKTFQAFGIATVLYVLAIAILELIGRHIYKRHILLRGAF
ncbi:amino acid ABC transporter permease [Microvirga sp. W0021]|uniref:Amino acid ABC transporter permease n=1 Tax=Hohaiivirga grylli TaxID=3133970 RepID=A0ABV0BLM3_9HYPH